VLLNEYSVDDSFMNNTTETPKSVDYGVSVVYLFLSNENGDTYGNKLLETKMTI